MRFSLGKIDSSSGSSHSKSTVQQSLDYINLVFEDFLEYGKLSSADITGKRFLELGPGDNVGVGLRFLAKGASQYVCLDKFYSNHDIENERQIYLALRERLPAEERQNLDAAVRLDEPGKITFNRERIYYIYGKGAQHADEAFPGEKFDGILSRVVLQEVYEIDQTFAAMDQLLSPGGVALHKIDLRDYGMFSANGFHPREFLTIPDSLYWMMAFDCDKPNRKMLNYYRKKMQDLGWDADLYITGVIETQGYRGSQQEIRPHKKQLSFGIDYGTEQKQLIAHIRPRLAAQFRDLADDDLLAAATFLVARKPA